jgi:hypothetical protein
MRRDSNIRDLLEYIRDYRLYTFKLEDILFNSNRKYYWIILRI